MRAHRVILLALCVVVALLVSSSGTCRIVNKIFPHEKKVEHCSKRSLPEANIDLHFDLDPILPVKEKIFVPKENSPVTEDLTVVLTIYLFKIDPARAPPLAI